MVTTGRDTVQTLRTTKANTNEHIDFRGRGAPLAAARIDLVFVSGQQVAMESTVLGRLLRRLVSPAPVLVLFA